MTVTGVGTQAHISSDEKVWKPLAQHSDGQHGWCAGQVCTRTIVVLVN